MSKEWIGNPKFSRNFLAVATGSGAPAEMQRRSFGSGETFSISQTA